MDSLVQCVRRWLISDSDPVVYECRNCGTTLGEQQNTCHVCGADEIVCYEIE